MPDSLVDNKKISCAFTGHREPDERFSPSLLFSAIEYLIGEGIVNFYCGMAMGYDLIAAEAVIKLRQNHPQIKLIACVPCPGQDRYFPAEEKKKYNSILPLCDRVEILSERYYKGCMLVRDRFMVDNCDTVLAHIAKAGGGTGYTVRYAHSKNRRIFVV